MDTMIKQLWRQLNSIKQPLEVLSTILSLIKSKNPAGVFKNILKQLITYALAKHKITANTGVLGRLLCLAERTLETYGFKNLAKVVDITNNVYSFSTLVYPIIAAAGGGPMIAMIGGTVAYMVHEYLLEKLCDLLVSIFGWKSKNWELESTFLDVAEIFVLFLLLITDIFSSDPPPDPPPNPPPGTPLSGLEQQEACADPLPDPLLSDPEQQKFTEVLAETKSKLKPMEMEAHQQTEVIAMKSTEHVFCETNHFG